MQTRNFTTRFDKVNGSIKVYDETKYLKLFELGRYHDFFNRNRFLIGVKSGIYVISKIYE